MENEREVKRYEGLSKVPRTHTLTHNTYRHTQKILEENGEWKEAVFKKVIVENFPDAKTNT